MLAGHITFENVLALVSGTITVLIGLDLIRPKSTIERAVLSELRRSRAGRASANAYRRWTTVVTGLFFLLGGGTLVVASLITRVTA